VFPARYELNSYIVFRKRLVCKRLKEERRLGMFGDRILTGIFGPKRQDVGEAGETRNKQQKQTPWSESACELTDRATAACRRSDCQLLRIEGATWSVWRIPTAVFSISRQEPLLFYQVAPQLYSRGWVDPVPDPLLFFSDSAVNRTRASRSVAKNSDH
jgi:hypothetical protein